MSLGEAIDAHGGDVVGMGGDEGLQGSEHGCGKPLPGAFNGQEVAAAGVMDAYHFLADKGDADGLFLGGFGKGVI